MRIRRLVSVLVGIAVRQHADRANHDRKVAPDRPSVEIIEVGLKAIEQVRLEMRRAAQALYLRGTGDARLDCVPLPVALIDLPEELVSCKRSQCMRTWADDAHVT